MKTHVKAGDVVVVIAGNAMGKHGRIMQVLPKNNRVLLEALEDDAEGKRSINTIKKHQKKSEELPEGGIIERESAIHISNVMKLERWESRQKKKGKAQK